MELKSLELLIGFVCSEIVFVGLFTFSAEKKSLDVISIKFDVFCMEEREGTVEGIGSS